MIDIVFPKDDEKDFIRLAERLNLTGLCFTYTRPRDISGFQAKTKLAISQAIICNPEEVRKYKGRYTTIVKAPEDQTKLRHIIEQTRPDILLNIEIHNKKDFIHHRASGLNHVLARIAEEKGVAIGFSFSEILKAKPKDRAIYLGRTMQNIRFARKFKFRIIIASFADNPWHLRPEQELASFFRTLGMTSGEAKAALDWRSSR